MSDNDTVEVEPEITTYWDEEYKSWAAFQGVSNDIIHLAPTQLEAFKLCLETVEENKREQKYAESHVRRETLRNLAYNLIDSPTKNNSLRSWLYRQREGEFFRNRRPSLQEVHDWLLWLSSRS
jgi:hypothetical protein